uniref:ATP synthase F0 subunit 6 n=1 Tax=Calliphora chinghaiensis TaxID=1767048 RepID=A0A0U2VY78_9MUSC|nr:ATP synthase F0 subunit 6 [Calliphora chinghaiensis]ALS20009.1 ATP synthase F0 subunit 6 [Calliphora chinghaiensis]
MMTNLFSVFDPSSSIFNLSLNWLSTFLGILMIPSMYWLMPSRYHIFWNNILLTLHKEFKILLGPMGTNGSTFIFVSLFSMILFNNFMGLFPYIFTSTSHLTLTLTLAMPLWLCFMLLKKMKKTQQKFFFLGGFGSGESGSAKSDCPGKNSGETPTKKMTVSMTGKSGAPQMKGIPKVPMGTSMTSILLSLLSVKKIYSQNINSGEGLIPYCGEDYKSPQHCWVVNYLGGVKWTLGIKSV